MTTGEQDIKSKFDPKDALKDGKEVILEMVPQEHQKRYLTRRQKYLIDNRHKAWVPGLDEYIMPDKFYPMFFDFDDTPTILPQGWFHYNIGLKWWEYKIGTEKLENFYLIRGSEAIENKYSVRTYLVYGSRKIIVRSKIIFPLEVKYAYARKTFKKKLNKLARVRGDTKLTEELYFNTLFRILGEKFQPGFDRESIKNQKYKENEDRKKRVRK